MTIKKIKFKIEPLSTSIVIFRGPNNFFFFFLKKKGKKTNHFFLDDLGWLVAEDI